jgi:4-hydroxy-3-methylbut-2-en-1-yl diphosphate synthase IspG/GcpE
MASARPIAVGGVPVGAGAPNAAQTTLTKTETANLKATTNQIRARARDIPRARNPKVAGSNPAPATPEALV